MTDLHSHSLFSDGTLAPADLVRLAAEKKVTALALTDHDTLAGLEEAAEAAGKVGIRFIPGVELSLDTDRGEFHLLGLGLRLPAPELEEALFSLRNARDERNLKMVEKMRQSGLEVEYGDIQSLAGADGEAGEGLDSGVVGRPHFARFLVNRGVCRTLPEAFEKFLGRGRPFYEPKRILTLEEALVLLSRAGGLAVVAHPLSLQLSWENLEARFDAWSKAGIAGVETLHPSATRGKTARLEKLARQYGLETTAGSDYHGANAPGRKLGRTGWGARIPERYDAFLDRLGSR